MLNLSQKVAVNLGVCPDHSYIFGYLHGLRYRIFTIIFTISFNIFTFLFLDEVDKLRGLMYEFLILITLVTKKMLKFRGVEKLPGKTGGSFPLPHFRIIHVSLLN